MKNKDYLKKIFFHLKEKLMIPEDMESSIINQFEDETLIDFMVRNAKFFLADFSVHGFRLIFGFVICHSILNFQSFLTWAFPIVLFDYMTIHFLNHMIHQILPLQLQGFFTNQILPRLIACGLVCLAFQQSLLLYLTSILAYHLFCYFSQYFSSRVLESTTMMFAFSSPWYIFPSLVKVGLSVMFVMDSFMSLTSIQALLRCYFMKTILNDLGIQIPEKKPPDYRYRLPYLSEEDNLQYRLLRSRYLNNKDEGDIKSVLDKMRKYLEELYSQNPAKYTTINGREIALPLEWHDLEPIMTAYPNEKNAILNQYYLHQVHTAWRMTQTKNYWITQQSQYETQHHELNQGVHQELVVMIWLHHQDEKSQNKFIDLLASINRMNNHDDIHPGPDKPADTKHFRIHLIQSTRFIHALDFISDALLEHLFHSFLQIKWLNQLRAMQPRDVERVQQVWLRLCEGLMLSQEQLQVVRAFNIDKTDKTDFIIKMHALFGRSWLHSSNHAKQVDYCFKYNAERFICPAEQYKSIFSESLEQYHHHESALQMSLNLPRI